MWAGSSKVTHKHIIALQTALVLIVTHKGNTGQLQLDRKYTSSYISYHDWNEGLSAGFNQESS